MPSRNWTLDDYYSDDWQLIEVQDAGDPVESYVWGQRYIDALIARDRDTDANQTLDERLYTVQDANFRVTGIVNTTGSVQERYSYTPYGERAIYNASWTSQASSSFAWRAGHQGLLHDDESALVYNRNRMLHPVLGRFLQRDSWMKTLGAPTSGDGYQDGMNLYLYLRGDPISNVDPQGLATATVNYACRVIGARCWGSCTCSHPLTFGFILKGAMQTAKLACCPTSCQLCRIAAPRRQPTAMMACMQAALRQVFKFPGITCTCT